MIETIILIMLNVPPITVGRFKSMEDCERAKMAYQERDKTRKELYKCIIGTEL